MRPSAPISVFHQAFPTLPSFFKRSSAPVVCFDTYLSSRDSRAQGR
jgi:hypothetical protein